MTSKAEMFGAALGKAFRKTAEKLKEEAPPAKMYRTNLRDVPKDPREEHNLAGTAEGQQIIREFAKRVPSGTHRTLTSRLQPSCYNPPPCYRKEKLKWR